jgi:hypothetical protein
MLATDDEAARLTVAGTLTMAGTGRFVVHGQRSSSAVAAVVGAVEPTQANAADLVLPDA